MKFGQGMAVVGALAAVACAPNTPSARAEAPPADAASRQFAGTDACRACHPSFYALWSTSHHGTAMQPFTVELARRALPPQAEPITIGQSQYRFECDDAGGRVRETTATGAVDHRVEHVMGGKNVYYLLTPRERGRLQVLPVAFDVAKQAWFDAPASALRHFGRVEDELLDWREREFTFNASCYGCHVSQLATNYDAATDTYRTQWAEPGINCETCHGPGGEHVRAFRAAEKTGEKPADLKLIRMADLTPAQRDAACAACHAKLMLLSADFKPGERFFDHFDLVTLEDRDFYADGRDLGENYTWTQWLMNSCAQAGQLECLHCHTSSGRYRFANKSGAEANGACLPCHAERVANVAAHSHHLSDGPAGRCIACHMPQTTFARMKRSDHSLRPPMPAGTLAFGSPNACNLCHPERDAAWADGQVKTWHAQDYQAARLRPAGLIQAARADEWGALPAIGKYLTDPKRDAVTAASLLRLLASCPDEAKWPIVLQATRDPSPLVRSAAVAGLAGCAEPEALAALLAAAADDYRVVRVRAGAALAGWSRQLADAGPRAAAEKAMGEFETALRSRLDDPHAHLSLGNYHMDRGQPTAALANFDAALRIDPRSVPARINAALACNLLGDRDQAEARLRDALRLAPASPAAHLNLGLLLGEQGKAAEAARELRAALAADPKSAVAAYNLAVLVAGDDVSEAIELCSRAARLAPGAPRYAHTLAYFQRQAGDSAGAVRTLEETIARHADFPDAYALLGQIYAEQGAPAQARAVYQRAAREPSLPPEARAYFAAQAGEAPR